MIRFSFFFVIGSPVLFFSEATSSNNDICADGQFIKDYYDSLYPSSVLAHSSGTYVFNDGAEFMIMHKKLHGQLDKAVKYKSDGAAKVKRKIRNAAENITLPSSLLTLSRPNSSKASNKSTLFRRDATLSLCLTSYCGSLTPYVDELIDLYYGRTLNNFVPTVPTDISSLEGCSPSVCSLLSPQKIPNNYAILVLTTSNQMESTVRCIQSIETAKDTFDVLVVDDNSKDGTPEYLIKRGYAVMTTEEPNGLTRSWNKAYRMAQLMSYKYIIFANNDIIIPSGSISALLAVLSKYPIVVPLTTDIGAGHNPSQSILRAHEMSLQMEDYVNNPYNCQNIQKSLDRKMISIQKDRQHCDSAWLNSSRFNGFFFGVNMNLIKSCAFNSTHLFDPQDIMVGQENRLNLCITQRNFKPQIALGAFVFHFKSVTVKSSNYSSKIARETRENLIYYHSPSEKKRENYSIIFRQQFENLIASDVKYYPERSSNFLKICIATSNNLTNRNAGDIFTAKELKASLFKLTNYSVRLLNEGREWYHLNDCDILIIMLHTYDMGKIVSAPTNIVYVAWMRNWFHKWFAHSSLGNMNIVLSSSIPAMSYFRSSKNYIVKCYQRCPKALQLLVKRSDINIDLLNIATNIPLSEKELSHERTIDYLFTGNYWGVKRDIMELDPRDLVDYQGAIYGSGWSKSSVYTNWTSLTRGPIPYSALPVAYRSSKIVIDDANHVTKPWGSVNSRVYDALAAGCLVITNGKIGSKCSFNNNLPIYESISDLKELLVHFLRNSSNREGITNELQHRVLSNHTYDNRVKELASILSDYGIPLDIETIMKTKFVNRHSISKSVCIGLRTYEAQQNVLSVFLGNMMAQYKDSKYSEKVGMKIYLANTDKISKNYEKVLIDTVNSFNLLMESENSPFVTLVSPRVGKKAFSRVQNYSWFGYDSSDMLLDVMKADESCELILFTNADNYYNKAWFDNVAYYVNNNSILLVTWNFVTHHSRNNTTEQAVQTQFKRKFIDLGGAVVRRSLYVDSAVSFLPNGIFTSDIFARDFFTISTLRKSLKPSQLVMLDKILFFHQ